MIEEWINITLAEAEELKELPDATVKQDAKLAINRYGIDRYTLLNAGIPNDEVTRLYKSLFVHTQGFLNHIHDVISKVNEDHLGI